MRRVRWIVHLLEIRPSIGCETNSSSLARATCTLKYSRSARLTAGVWGKLLKRNMPWASMMPTWCNKSTSTAPCRTRSTRSSAMPSRR
ncbi:MAG: hypothetical protein ACD_23C01010G0001 [uncultured bacterium]|nr:MAG: hypothetical protein ACD_23C01010G0001 [uncultured bacterium]